MAELNDVLRARILEAFKDWVAAHYGQQTKGVSMENATISRDPTDECDYIVSHPPLKQVGLRLNPKVRRHRPTDTGPITDIAGSIDISKVRMTAANTTERGLIRTVALVNRPASVARLRCVARINQQNTNAAQLCFVRDVPAKLIERPVAELGACGFPNRCALANMRQIFQRYSSRAAFGFPHKLLCNGVVDIRLEAALLAADLSEATFGAFCANRLQGITTALIPLSHAFYLCAAVLFAIAIRGKVHNPQIDPQHRVTIIRRWFVNGARYKEVELTVAKHQIAFALSGQQHLALPFATDKRDGLPVFVSNRPHPHGLPLEIERQDAIIVGDTAVRSVGALCLAIQLVAIAHFRKTTDHHLRRQAVVRLDTLIDQLLQIILPKDLLFPRHAADLVTRGVRRFKCALQRISLFGRRLQLDLGDDFHILNCSTEVRRCQPWAQAAQAGRFLRVPCGRLKPVGFRA
ncbi:MAG: hypothetical protein KatS3mg057_2520 [Herpetosiphonaceae bacterium]|nr:MAG: hypothetical protein KatS3mg057_2520 [Herpetosiphonaceae bacterium]